VESRRRKSRSTAQPRVCLRIAQAAGRLHIQVAVAVARRSQSPFKQTEYRHTLVRSGRWEIQKIILSLQIQFTASCVPSALCRTVLLVHGSLSGTRSWVVCVRQAGGRSRRQQRTLVVSGPGTAAESHRRPLITCSWWPTGMPRGTYRPVQRPHSSRILPTSATGGCDRAKLDRKGGSRVGGDEATVR